MMGHSLRSGKGVYSLYCGGDGGEGEGGEGEVPEGFYRAQGGEGGGRKGCGALVCARALVEGVPRKVFDDGDGKKGKGREEEAVSSDLPPHGGRVGDWDDGTTEEGAERVGRRGWKGCKGCVTRDVGCKRWCALFPSFPSFLVRYEQAKSLMKKMANVQRQSSRLPPPPPLRNLQYLPPRVYLLVLRLRREPSVFLSLFCLLRSFLLLSLDLFLHLYH